MCRVWAGALCFSILAESIKRFYEPQAINNPLLVLIVGSIGLVVNIIGLYLFHASEFKPFFSAKHSVYMKFNAFFSISLHTCIQDHGNEADKQQFPIAYFKSLSSSESISRSSPSADPSKSAPKADEVSKDKDKDKERKKKNSHNSVASSSSQSSAQRGVFLHILAYFLGSVRTCIELHHA